jgi:group I intron endonuclease
MTAGVYSIRNKVNNRIYIGSSISIENRYNSHIKDLSNHSHHSWKLQKDWDLYGYNAFTKEVLHKLSPKDEHLELLLEILERSEIFLQHAVTNGYNVSDEIIRDTSLVLKFCDETIETYFKANKEKFTNAINNYHQGGFLTKLLRWAWSSSNHDKPENLLNIDNQAHRYLQTCLKELFVKSNLDEKTAKILAKTYVSDTKKLRGNSFKYWRQKN